MEELVRELKLTPETAAFKTAVLEEAVPRGKRLEWKEAASAWAIAMVDMAALSLALYLAYFVRLMLLPSIFEFMAAQIPKSFPSDFAVFPAAAVLCFVFDGLYTARMPFWTETKKVVKALTLSLLVVIAFLFFSKTAGEVSRSIVMVGYLLSLLLVPFFRYLSKRLLYRAGLYRRPVLIMGAGRTGEIIAGRLLQDPYLGMEVAGFLDDDPAKRKRGVRIKNRTYPILGTFGDALTVMRQKGIGDVIVATPGMENRKMVGLINKLQLKAASVVFVPDLFGVPVANVVPERFFDEQILAFRAENNMAKPLNLVLKRLFDLVVGSLALIVALPIMAVIAVAIKLDSPGPVIFAQIRPGRNGTRFNCYKFRTMVVNAEAVLKELLEKDPTLRREWESDFKLKNDPRITKVGRFLRKTSLDELPQIFNVFKGQMSLVGPRPHLLCELERPDPAGMFSVGLSVNPGMTGLWQVSGRSEVDYQDRLKMDAWYVRNWSLWLDVSILFRTVVVLLSRRGAY